MARTVQIDEAQALFSDLIANVEAGEEILITRGSQPVARLSNFARPRNLEKIVAEVNARARMKPVKPAEILAWRYQGHIY